MKKIFTLCLLFCATTLAMAQGFEFQYQGQSLSDGATVTIAAETDAFGELSCETNSTDNPTAGLMLKLLSSTTANVRASIEITYNTLNAKVLQWCMGGECTPFNNATSLSKEFTVDGSVQAQFDATNIQSTGYLTATLTASIGLETHKVNILFTNGETPAKSVWWGYFNESDFAVFDGLIGTGTPMALMAAIYVPANHEELGTATINAVRVYLEPTYVSTLSNMKVWISKSLPTNINNADYVQDINVALKANANDFELTTPYAVNNSGFYIGYYVNSTYGYSIRTAGKVVANSLWIGNPAVGMSWTDGATIDLGKLAFQIQVEGGNFADYSAIADDFGPSVVELGQQVNVPVNITNMGAETIQSLAYTIEREGNTTEEHMISSLSIPYGSSQNVEIPFNAAENVGKYTYTLTLTKVNGNENAANHPTASGNITTVENLKTWPRNVLIEEFTTEQCVYCPQAASGLASFLTSNPNLAERVAVACHHAGYYTDWLTISASNSYTWFYNDGGATYAPAFMYDRYAWDGTTPVVSRESGAAGYKNRVEQRIEVPSYADIQLNATFDNDKKTISVAANCERGWEYSEKPARITLFLTEDNITAKSQSGASGTFIHQHVLRAVNSTWGTVLDWTDNLAEYNYTFTLNSSWKTNDLKVIAFISGYDNTDPTNCVVENVKVTVPVEQGTGIEKIVNNQTVGAKEYFTLDGRQVAGPQKGLNIIRMSDGTTRKVVIK